MEDYFKGICPKYVEWIYLEDNACSGKSIHGVCNFGVDDLIRVQSSNCLFANKFNMDVSADAILAHFSYVIDISEATMI